MWTLPDAFVVEDGSVGIFVEIGVLTEFELACISEDHG